ncbi:Leucine carboxyl methyltransferase 1 OS=Cryptococcus neoformans var, neoformans serotype D (strain B-3501A) GN=PPM1 PE=3 SV=1 [Rhizoctonia solani AG-1 IB]|uniref:Leucine carboxyl methyltransferase 1 n=1 Tax=Thanatephorus cucumeris (strain AG1-IB / isolate 7/3/14) TaxID=1108050 RepID=A0A0B7F4Y5_THACB|nr:Leucine carboxyl methyltransferase 1 OS=Cryptococcus neoformans var, neoformans serotype D (strain B-3501A) GN=PPM1 PE=3 SV=1 [Rhizoctonia solani AG-1 IB]
MAVPRMLQPENIHKINDSDSAIRETDTDAAHSRLSAVRQGYLVDPYLAPLVPRARFVPTRAPLMNVGTYVRSTAIDMLVESWLDLAGAETEKRQIVSLGAGSDTRYWRLMDKGYRDRIASYVELDFTENTSRKAKAVMQSQPLSNALGPGVKIERGGIGLSSPNYHLIPLDLREGASALEILTAASSSSPPLDPSLPTLFIAECVFVYMPPNASGAIIQWFSNTFKRTAGIVYEMFGLQDSFGKVLKDNLKARHIELPGVDAFPTLDSQMSRYINNGFVHSKGRTLKSIRRENIPVSELQRISRLEHLDEIEELELVLEHYSVTWGYSDRIASGENGGTNSLRQWDLALQIRPVEDDE